jgi:uncharacterized protein YndB with AHSA1/START domain
MSETQVMTAGDLEVVVTRVLDAPRELVWQAWTQPEHVQQWLLGPGGWTMPICEIDLRAGGEWHFGWQGSDGSGMDIRGTYEEVTPPERLVSRSSWGGDWPETTETLVLAEEGGKTTVTQTIVYPSKEARDAALETGMTDGMSASFDRLADYLRSQ